MDSPPPFENWVVAQTPLTRRDIEALDLLEAFSVMVDRFATATHRGASDPFVTVSTKRAGGNSRQCTNRQLDLLGYTRAQRRIVHRLLAGTPSGFPGLLALYVGKVEDVDQWHSYLRRQVRDYVRLSRTETADADAPPGLSSVAAAVPRGGRAPRRRTDAPPQPPPLPQRPGRTAPGATRRRSRG